MLSHFQNWILKLSETLNRAHLPLVNWLTFYSINCFISHRFKLFLRLFSHNLHALLLSHLWTILFLWILGISCSPIKLGNVNLGGINSWPSSTLILFTLQFGWRLIVICETEYFFILTMKELIGVHWLVVFIWKVISSWGSFLASCSKSSTLSSISFPST